MYFKLTIQNSGIEIITGIPLFGHLLYPIYGIITIITQTQQKKTQQPKNLLRISKQQINLIGYEFIYLSQFTQAYNESVIQNHQIVMEYIANPFLVFTV